MVRLKYVTVFFLILMAGILALLLFFPGEEKKVKSRFSLLAENVSKVSGENTFTMAKKIKGISDLFGGSCQVRVSDYSLSGVYTREEISGIALRARAHFSQLGLKFYDLKISFPEDNVARVNLTGRLRGKSIYGEHVDEIRELVCLLQKVEKNWLFTNLEVIEVLKK